jgi:L-2-hydroxyglutarate oxidase LhgO
VPAPKAPKEDGRVSLMCEDDSKEGTAAFVVIVAGDGADVLAQAHTTVGE